MRVISVVLLPAALSAAIPVSAAAPDAARGARPVLRSPSVTPPAAVSPAARVAGLAEKADEFLDRAGRPGLRDEDRDELVEQAWALCDEALGDPILKDEALRAPSFLRIYALLLMEDRELDDALGILERLRSLGDAAPETHELLGACFMEMGRAEEAIVAYRRALLLRTEAPAAIRARLAYAIAATGRREEGLRSAEQAVVADPEDYFGYFVRGWILAALERREEAKRDYLRAVERFRDDADLWDLLGELSEREGDRGRALECYREVVRIDPSDDAAAAKVRELANPAPRSLSPAR